MQSEVEALSRAHQMFVGHTAPLRWTRAQAGRPGASWRGRRPE